MYKEKENKKVYNIDFDGTLTTGEYINDPEPDLDIVYKVTKLYMGGDIIIVWTARQWSQANILVSWLIRHNVPFHGVMMGKGGSDCYIDDKAIELHTFKYEELCRG